MNKKSLDQSNQSSRKAGGKSTSKSGVSSKKKREKYRSKAENNQEVLIVAKASHHGGQVSRDHDDPSHLHANAETHQNYRTSHRKSTVDSTVNKSDKNQYRGHFELRIVCFLAGLCAELQNETLSSSKCPLYRRNHLSKKPQKSNDFLDDSDAKSDISESKSQKSYSSYDSSVKDYKYFCHDCFKYL